MIMANPSVIAPIDVLTDSDNETLFEADTANQQNITYNSFWSSSSKSCTTDSANIDAFPADPIINLSEKFDGNRGQRLVINCCSRSYCFDGVIDKGTLFWDQNYLLAHHKRLLTGKVLSYIDGMELLTLQGKYALKFWGILD